MNEGSVESLIFFHGDPIKVNNNKDKNNNNNKNNNSNSSGVLEYLFSNEPLARTFRTQDKNKRHQNRRY